ncbi:hypothetical protein NEMIN01_1277 [Nematocida minor]|uniref:uncharacterized protein n=1 Tax=Nematocida minor TaxID=1912983 RepID=UPI00221F6626|nr:uncharacterized protein NEMIN01_1277 [Nematocida minor]KAI5190944.1 hypothetical protein NEMIN01_1277 [Nematocida minor]
MARREVKLKINVEGLIQAAQSIASKYDEDFYDAKCKSVRDLAILKDIFEGNNLEIESEHSDEEKKDILGIIKNDMYQFSLENGYHQRIMSSLCDALRDKKHKEIESHAFCLINQFTRPRPYIYRTEHGIYRKKSIEEPLELTFPNEENPDKSARICSILVNDANLKNTLHLTEENLNKNNFSNVGFLLYKVKIDDLKEFAFLRKVYTLDDLYSLNENNMPLVDYGLKLISDKRYDIEVLTKKIRGMKASYKHPIEIKREINKVFPQKDLEIVISIFNNMEEIGYEKNLYDYITNALEYIATKTLLLRESDTGLNILRLKTDLSNFYEDYTNNNSICLYKILLGMLDKYFKEKKEGRRSRDIAIEECSKKTKNLQSWMEENKSKLDSETYDEIVKEKNEEIEELNSFINNLKKKLWVLDREYDKANEQKEKIRHFKDKITLLSKTSPDQKKHLLKKIKEVGELLNFEVLEEVVELVEAKKEPKNVPSADDLRRERLIRNVFGGFLAIGGLTAAYLNHRSENEAMDIDNSDNALNSDQESYRGEPPTKKYK